MNYTIHQLRIYLKVIEKQSITKASEELFMTQPAVSIQLKNFQDQFNIPLTELIGRNLHVTEFGLEIAAIAKRIIDEVDAIRFKSKEFEGLLTGTLKISSASTGKYLIPYFLTDFMHDHEGIDLQLDVTNKSKVIESLKNNEIDFALVSVLPDDIDVEEELLLENKLYLVSNPNMSQKGMPMIYREQGSATRAAMEAYIKSLKNANTYSKRIELTSNEAVKQAVIAGIGQSILPIIGMHNEIIDGTLAIIKKRGLPIKTDWRLIWLKKKTMSPVAKAYLDFIRSQKNEIIETYFSWNKEF